MSYRGLKIALAAKFNTSYHRTGIGLAEGLEQLGCDVSRVDLRTRSWQHWSGRSLARRLGSAARGADVVLSYKAAELTPAVIAESKGQSRALWVNWFPDSPHLLDVALTNSAGYDRCFLFDSSMVDRLRAAGRPAEFLPLGFDPAGIGVPQLCDAKADIARSFVEDEEIGLFRSGEELRAKAEALLSDARWRHGVAERGRQRALGEHTWRARLAELLGRVLR